jgi:hypothetical protein
MDIETTVADAATTAIEEYPSTTKTVLITVAATAVTMIGAKLVLNRHFKKATEMPVETESSVKVDHLEPANA